MKKYYLQLMLIILALVFGGCSTKTPTSIAGKISLPVTFKSVWYRPTLDKSGYFVMTDTGTLSVEDNFIKFEGEKEVIIIPFSEIISVSFKKLGSDFINKWVVIKYGKQTPPKYAVMSDGRYMGWAGGSSKIFSTIKYATKK